MIIINVDFDKLIGSDKYGIEIKLWVLATKLKIYTALYFVWIWELYMSQANWISF